MSLVQGHRKDVSFPVPPTMAPSWVHCWGNRLGALVLRPLSLLIQVSLCPQVHSACKELFGKRCPLGQYKVSIIPPTALNSIDSDGESWRGQGWAAGGGQAVWDRVLSSSAGFDLSRCACFPVGQQEHHHQ